MSGHLYWIDYARQLSKNSLCQKMHFGAAIVRDGLLLSEGVNQPYDGKICNPCLREEYDLKSSMNIETCKAVHAEQMALLNALNNQVDISGALMYIAGTRPNGEPYYMKPKELHCTVCTRLLDKTDLIGIVISTEDGPSVMSLDEAIDSAFKDMIEKIASKEDK